MANPHKRNFDRVKFEKLRKTVDRKINALHDDLEQAYYGTYDDNGRFTDTGWRNRVEASCWRGRISNRIEKLPTLIQRRLSVEGQTGLLGRAKAKRLFDYLHGRLFELHQIAMVEENEKLPAAEREDIDHLDPVEDGSERRSVASAARLQVLKDEGVDLRDIRDRTA